MAKDGWVGVNNVSRHLIDGYIGINNIARNIVAGWVGDANGKAQQIYVQRVYLYKQGNINTTLTGGWTGTFTHQTDGGVNYTMTRMSNSNGYLIGSISGTAGSEEKALYVRTNNTVNLSKWKKLCCQLERYTSRASSFMSDAYFGAFNSSYTTCQTQQLSTRFLKYATHENSVNSGYQSLTLTVDISSLNGSYYILYDNYKSNINAVVNIRIKNIWLES